MSKSRQALGSTWPEPDILVRSWTHRIFNGTRLEFFDRLWMQLIYAVEGVVTVSTPEGLWVVPPSRAVWIPPGIPREARAGGSVSLRCLYFRPSPAFPRRCQAVSVTPLARELIRHVAEQGPLKADRPKDRRLARVLLDQLVDLPVLPILLPPPESPEALRAAELIVSGDHTLEQGARASGLSKRTLERRFRDETGMSLGAWIHQARMVEAMRRLAAGDRVNEVADQVGYQSPSAFIAAFRRTFGATPGAVYDR